MIFLKNKIFCFFLLISSCLYGFSDLEEYAHDFFLEIKKIDIKGFSEAFNPSITRWKGRWLMSFRVINASTSKSLVSSATESGIGLVYLDENLNPVGEPQFIYPDHPDKKRACLISEDARLIVDEGRLYMIYSANKEAEVEDGGFRIYVAELDSHGDDFFILSNECLSFFESANPCRREKNWVPFFNNGELLLSYSLYPHKVFKPLLNGSGICETVAKTFPSIVWEWGELRGGTPALKLNEDYYLGFFHSSTNLRTVHSDYQLVPHYFMGAYLFSSKYPFEIKYISPEPIIGPNFYHGLTYEPYWHPLCVVFPCGLIINEDEIWVTYGRQDHEIWIAKVDRKMLVESLIHVSQLPCFNPTCPCVLDTPIRND